MLNRVSEADLQDDLWDVVADVVVVGGGAAGFAAALAAAGAGASVVLLERGLEVGGTTAKSGGQMLFPDNPLMRAAGIDDPRADALRLFARTAQPHRYDPDGPTLGLAELDYQLLCAFYDESAGAIELLTDMGAVDLELAANSLSYHADLPEEKVPHGRTLSPVDRPANRDHGTGGEMLIRRMRAAAEQRGVVVRTGHRVVGSIATESGDVVGLEVQVGRQASLFGARRGVVFASGGFLHDPDMRQQFLRGPVFGGCAAETCTGDFVRIASSLGVSWGNMSNAWWNQVVVEMALRQPSTIRDVWMPFGDSMLQVNRYGRRVVNEKAPYNERGQVHFQWDPTRREYPNLVTFMIYDDAVAQHPSVSGFRQPVPAPGESEDFVLSAPTLPALAEAIERRLGELGGQVGHLRLDPEFVENLRATVARFDEMAVAGVDQDFGRGSAPIQVAWGGGDRNPANPTMHPFSEQGPYYCILLGAGSLDTKGGPRIDPRGQVLDSAGVPLPGLFGAGNCVAGPAGQAYWGPGGTIGPAMVFGVVAGRSAAQEEARF